MGEERNVYKVLMGKPEGIDDLRIIDYNNLIGKLLKQLKVL
jgi:hypothetical protein